MAPNDVGMARVWTRDIDGTVEDLTFPSETAFQVVVDCEAGSTMVGSGAPWWIDIFVRDLSDCEIVHKDTHKGNMGSDPWIYVTF